MEDSPRLRRANACPVQPDGRYVVYWMTMQRRLGWNFALDRAVAWARGLGKPLVVFETLVSDYPWACPRFHGFIQAGMHDHAAALADGPVRYYGFVEHQPGEMLDRFVALAGAAAVVVTDDHPGFVLPWILARAAARVPVAVEAVDGNGLVPLQATDRAFPTARGFRSFVRKELAKGLALPKADPFAGGMPAAGEPFASRLDLPALTGPGVVAETPGGSVAGARRLEAFLADGLPRYLEDRLNVDRPATSGLSPYLHFGHVGAHQIVARIPGRGEAEEAFLDQLVTWRELGFNGAAHLPRYDEWESLPGWARSSLEQHMADPRPERYSFAQLEAAETADPIWNAAQRELVGAGRIHNYLRMLWGKKVLEWSASPQEALAVLIELNNRYALDGRDPNSYSGIFWCFGRYDRAWGPERPIFGKIRYMTSPQAAKKLKLKNYLARWGAPRA